MNSSEDGKAFAPDALDLLIIGELVREPSSTFKRIASVALVDQRTIARRVGLMKHLGVIRPAFEVDWERLGVGASAIVGCTTLVGERALERLLEYIKEDPRIVESYETVGAHEYVLKVLGNDITDLRNSVLRDLQPLAGDLTTSVVSSELKKKDYFQYVRYLRETRYPGTRSSSWGDTATIR